MALVGLAWVGAHLVRAWPRTVEVAYVPGPEVTRVDVDYLIDGEAVGSVRFRQTAGKASDLRDTLRLPPGEYQAQITLYRAEGPAVELLRTLIVPAAGLTRFDLRTAP